MEEVQFCSWKLALSNCVIVLSLSLSLSLSLRCTLRGNRLYAFGGSLVYIYIYIYIYMYAYIGYLLRAKYTGIWKEGNIMWNSVLILSTYFISLYSYFLAPFSFFVDVLMRMEVVRRAYPQFNIDGFHLLETAKSHGCMGLTKSHFMSDGRQMSWLLKWEATQLARFRGDSDKR